MINKSESANALDAGGVTLAKGVDCIGNAHAEGTYLATLIGPREECRDEYVKLRNELWAFEAAGNAIEAARIKSLMTPMEETKWSEEFDNVVTNEGKNFFLTTLLSGSAYSVTGPYIGLIGSTASSASVNDTMASHVTWNEVGGTNAPTYSGARGTASWAVASGGERTTNAPVVFNITGAGTVGGCFMGLGTGASSTKDNTSGVLYSAGAFTGGSKTVNPGDTLNVNYTAKL